MKVTKFHWIGLAVVLAGVFGVLSLGQLRAQNAGGTAVGPTKVAVCDIVKVFREYQRAKDLTKELKKRTQAFATENTKRKTALDVLRNEMEGFKAGSPEYEKIMRKLRGGIVEREVWGTMEKESLMRDHLRLTKEMYKEIKNTIAAVSKQSGVDLTLQLDPDLGNIPSAEAFIAQISRNKVLYNTKQVDLTEAVLQKLNEAYRIKKGK
ncbi:MAG: OmpH family outer membrane protein [Phycisphaerae bacterium]|nr:OmpH family outer membrane protein [Phycisphaerae bacterium]